MNKTKLDEINEFLKVAYYDLKNGGTGVWYSRLGYDKSGDTELYLAVSKMDDNEIRGKIAVNNSSLQCDYDYDFYMPYYKNGEVFDTDIEITNIKDDAKSFLIDFDILKKYEILDNGIIIG